MAEYKQVFDLPISYDSLWAYCCETAENIGWEVEKKVNGDIVLKSRDTLQTKAQILVVSTSQEQTLLTIIVSTPESASSTVDVNQIGENIHETIIKKWVDKDVENIRIRVGIKQGLICPTCHEDMIPGIRFCPNDGTPISKGCENCDATNMPSAQFCYKCGKSFKVENLNTPNAAITNLPIYGETKNSEKPFKVENLNAPNTGVTNLPIYGETKNKSLGNASNKNSAVLIGVLVLIGIALILCFFLTWLWSYAGNSKFSNSATAEAMNNSILATQFTHATNEANIVLQPYTETPFPTPYLSPTSELIQQVTVPPTLELSNPTYTPYPTSTPYPTIAPPTIPPPTDVPQPKGMHIHEYCQSKGYEMSTLVSNDAYGWRCQDISGTLYNIDMYDVCKWEYDGGTPQYKDFNDANSWVCIF